MQQVRFASLVALPNAQKLSFPEEIKDAVSKPLEAPSTAWSALVYGNVQDGQLARLDDTMKKMGTLAIATLGSLGVAQMGGSLPLWLGALSWMTAMLIPPFLINGLVYLKTGINLNTRYVNSNGEIHPLFLDPNYLPLQLIPQQKRIQLAKQWGIDPDNADRPLIFHNKLQQIAVQARTWWMLMAGPATPLLAALICDRLEEPFKNWIARLRIKQADTALQALSRHPAAHPDRWKKALEQRINASIGTHTQISVLSRWWQQLPPDLVKTLQLDTLGEKEILSASPSKLCEKIAAHLSQQLRQPKSRHGVLFRVGFEDLLKRQEQKLAHVFQPLQKVFQNPHLPVVTKAELEYRLLFEKRAAEATLQHFKSLLALPIAGVEPDVAQKVLLHQMQHARLSSVVDQMGYESCEKAVQLAGGPKQATLVLESYVKRRFEQAFKTMGASPMESLSQAIRSYGLRKRWMRLYPGMIGKVMIAATLVYVTFFVGKDFEKKGA